MTRTVCLAWGSLVWNPGKLEPYLTSQWYQDGPALPVEFARVSRNGRLTLVLVPGRTPLPVLWAEMRVRDVAEARQVVKEREGCELKAVGVWPSDAKATAYQEIADWAAQRDIQHVVWTGLGAKFNGEALPPVDAAAAIDYLRGLQGDVREEAERYVRKAPLQIATAFRKEIEVALGWSPEA